MKFNKNKFLQLLKEKALFISKNGSLKDFQTLYREKYLKLLEYQGLLEENIFWKRQKRYIKILDDFIHNKIVFDQFMRQLFNLKASNRKLYRELIINLEKNLLTNPALDDINIDYNPKSVGFIKLVSDLELSADICDPELSTEKNLKLPEQVEYRLSEELFKLNIEEFFLPKMKNY